MDNHFHRSYNKSNKSKEIGVIDLVMKAPVKSPEKTENLVVSKIKALNTKDINEMVKALGLDGVAFGDSLLDVYKKSR
ncbi:hypothetical protein [Neobacillus drentensis]|uniref:hypothetical protein n=1 Tax=Neobacillus drentensis TaxID=220684 RepID=UPI0028649D47|nr:hypothetical protein [Neobacillus drentensis]MDR7237327.1 hypothetical protein [Neobacillus drentensis]